MIEAAVLAIWTISYIIRKLFYDPRSEIIKSAGYYTRKVNSDWKQSGLELKSQSIVVHTFEGNSYYLEHPSLGSNNAKILRFSNIDKLNWTKKFDI